MRAPPGFQLMYSHMIFNVKSDGFRSKARIVAGSHQAETPASVLSCSSVVSRETVHIAFTVATLKVGNN